MKEIDMTPYEEYFTELERLYFERNARMNIVAYMSDKQFNESQYDRVFQDYLKVSRQYDNYINEFEQKVVIPVCGAVNWTADFERRVLNVTSL